MFNDTYVMSTLQISLAVAGGLILAGVVAHGAWSARRNAPKQADRPAESKPDTVAESNAMVEDGFSAAAVYPDERQEPSFAPETLNGTGIASYASTIGLATPEKKPSLDALIDVIAPVAVDAVVSGEAALAAMPSTRRVGSKPFGVEGLSTVTGEWEFPAVGQRYGAFQCAVQLANRTGALNQIEFSEFVMKTQAFADVLGGEAEFPDMLDEVARARELDQFASAHDAQLSFTIRPRGTAWSPGYVQQNAGRLGFIAGALPGRMVLPASAAGQAPLLGLSFNAQAAMSEIPEDTALREFTLSLDVPQVPQGEQPFTRLCESAIALAQTMEGTITDDAGAPIRPEAMQVIHVELQTLYGTLESRDLAAGSVLARRLFS